MLKQAQAKRLKKAGVKVEKGEAKAKANGASNSGTVTPGAQTVPPLDDFAREMEKSEFMRKINQ